MFALLRHLLSADYLYAPRPVPAGLASAEFAGWALALLALSLCAVRWHRTVMARGGSPAAPRAMLALLLAAALALACQVLADGPLSARIWTLSLSGLALATPAYAYMARRDTPKDLQPILRSLAGSLRPGDPALPLGATIAWVLGHAAALGSALILSLGDNRAAQDPRAIGAALLSAIIALTIPAVTADGPARRRTVRVELLAPLLLPYLVLRLQWFVTQTVGADTGAYQAYPFPDLWSPWFDPAVPWLIAAASMLLSASACARRERPDVGRWLMGLGAAGGLAWLVTLLMRHLSAGAAGSDPFAYLQMAADLATTGDLRHTFPLVPLALEADVPLWPLVPVGYHPPLTGVAATVWPPGWPALLAPLYRLGGETLALWGAPVCLLLSGCLTATLAFAIVASTDRRHTPIARWGLAAALLLTSYETLTRSVVPMADAAAAASTLLCLLALLRARATGRLRWSALAGLALALAYTIRHPLLPLALAALPALAGGPWPRRRRLANLALFGALALAGSLPDLWYHRLAFGSPWISESAEWFLLSPANIPATLAGLWRDGLMRRNEFGYLWPLVLAGLWASLRHRDERPGTLILLTGGGAVLLFHLSYEALRMRDLIPLFPLLALWAARGASALWVRANQGAHPQARRALVALALLFLLACRSADTLALPLQDRIETFGHLTLAQRLTYERLGASLPESAVVATAASAGPVLRYAGREIVRPAAWSAREFDRMLHALERDGHSLVVLVDGEELEAWLPSLEEGYTVTLLSRWPLPRYGLGGQPLPGLAELYAIESP